MTRRNPTIFNPPSPQNILAGYNTEVTLRDLFAAAAMQALIVRTLNQDGIDYGSLAGTAYTAAEAMLSARANAERSDGEGA